MIIIDNMERWVFRKKPNSDYVILKKPLISETKKIKSVALCD